MAVILGIESSCDDTAAALVANGKLLANVVAGQEIHTMWGGVIPELASRAHQENIIPVVSAALKQAGKTVKDIDAIAFTQGPGLMGSLLVGSSFAKGLSHALNKPLLAVNHMQAHILAHFIEDDSPREKPSFPFVCLTVSGGHTQLVLVNDPFTFEVLGETMDDAAGEAFDKTAKILGLSYPGGPLIDKHAANGNPDRFKFPEANVPGYNYSFSGLKTSVLYFVRDHVEKDAQFVHTNMNDICASVQNSIIRHLLKKLKQVIIDRKITCIALAGGVSANSGLRKAVSALGDELNVRVCIPPFAYCTDNAAMIAMTGHFLFEKKEFSPLSTAPLPRYPV
ncbi:MAG TPA: tRNA (adenosine(37)-N6)-threonylcarbamoyltransferase complex transferase subunit TsaD [Bacteroidia bacterium]|nr:tRNA (adenosine(37)-N6)-threonylcarbamoyltransferase complex transferase subunit TsaD [Bacteroidia bacterium]